MILEASIDAVARLPIHYGLPRPLYESWCFSRLAATVRHALRGDAAAESLPAAFWQAIGDPAEAPFDEVIFLYLDAFSWKLFERELPRSPLLQRIASEGVVAKLTSQFPSTTAAHTAAIHTGLAPAQSGIFEWFFHEPVLDAVIAPLLFSFAGDRQRETLRAAGYTPFQLCAAPTIYEQLAACGTRSFTYVDGLYAHASYSAHMHRGAKTVTFRTTAEMLARLERERTESSGPTYHHLYYDRIDSISHEHGPDSPETAAEVRATLLVLDDLFFRKLARPGRRTLALITADHGHVAVDPAQTIQLNLAVPALLPLLRTGANGRPLAPAGSARDQFLYVRDECLDEAEMHLRSAIGDFATIHRTADLIAAGFFGPGEPSPTFLARMSNLLILPRDQHTVWWHEPGRFDMRHRGMHGGLARDELEIPLLALVV